MPGRDKTKRWQRFERGEIVIPRHVAQHAQERARPRGGEEACPGPPLQEHDILPGLRGQVPQQDGGDPIQLPENRAHGDLQRVLDTAHLPSDVSFSRVHYFSLL